MNAIASFRKCTLSNRELLDKIDSLTDGLFDAKNKSQRDKNLTRNIPAQPDGDYDLLIGEFMLRFLEMEKACKEVVRGYENDAMTEMSEWDEDMHKLCKDAIVQSR